MNRLIVEDLITDAGLIVNEDLAGHLGDLAWVIDGATDVLERRLIEGPSDAAWFATALGAELARLAETFPADKPLADLLQLVTANIARRFADEAIRDADGNHEHPSAAGVVVRLTGQRLDYLSLGDCQLVLRDGTGAPRTLGVDPGLAAGDRRNIDLMRRWRDEHGDTGWQDARARLWPRLLQGRARMNQPGGYGVFSITPPPAEFIRSGSHTVGPDTRLLLASDGFTRLSDIFARYDTGGLLHEAERRGLSPLLSELRSLERSDPECLDFPRTKPSDDATALLLRIAGGT